MQPSGEESACGFTRNARHRRESVAIMLAAHQMLREESEVGTSDPGLAFSNTALCQPASGGKTGGQGFVFHSPIIKAP